MKKLNISIIGKSNVGKSSLMNTLCNSYVSSVSEKKQTTRTNIKHNFIKKNSIFTINDTPGYFVKENNLLSSSMKVSYLKSVTESDIILIMFDNTFKLSQKEKSILESLIGSNNQIIIILNKIDLMTKDELKTLKNTIQIYFDKKLFPISTITQDGIESLLKYLDEVLKNLKSDVEHDAISENMNNLMTQEIIRGVINQLTHGEVPYDCAVHTEKILNKKQNICIKSTIYVEKSNQKKILIGSNGNQIKKIGSISREALEKISNKKIYLELFVVVKKNWKNSHEFLKKLGYIN